MINLSHRLTDFKKRKSLPTMVIISTEVEPIMETQTETIEETVEKVKEELTDKIEELEVTQEVFLSTVFSSISTIKLYHFESFSYAKHVSLGELYSTLSNLFDTFIESSQTTEKFKLRHYEAETEVEKTALDFLTDLLDYIRNNRNIFSLNHQLSQLDIFEQEISHTIYKLTLN